MNAEKAAIYCRISREDEQKKDESESIQNQRAMLQEYAKNQGWEVYETYVDEDYSGADHARPAFLRLIADAQQKRFSVVLCKTQSRFTRDMELVEEYIHRKFLLWGIRFVAVVDHIDTALDNNKKARQINGLINEWYLEDLSQNIKSVLDVKRRQGQYIGSFALYGYQKDPFNRHHLVPDPPAAQVVQNIFSLYLQGLGKRAIAQRLNGLGVPNPTAYKQLQGLRYQNGFANPRGLWNKQTIARILQNEMYTGTLVQGKKRKVSYKSKQLLGVPQSQWVRVPNAHEGIVPPEIFFAVQKALQTRTKEGKQGQKHPLAGLVFCAQCKSPMQKNQTTYKGTTRNYLQCKCYGANGGCTSHSIRLDRLLQAVAQAMKARIQNGYTPNLEAIIKKAQKSVLPVLQPPKPQQQRNALLQALGQLYIDKAAGVLTLEEYTRLHAQLKERLAALEDCAPSPAYTALKAQPQDATAFLKGCLAFETPPLFLARQMVEKVYVGEKSKNAQQVEIVWR